MEVKQGTAFRVPVKLRSATDGSALTGKAYTAVTCYIQKQAGSSAVKTLAGTDWFEIDATNFPGVYDLLLSTTNTDTVGFIKYSVTVSGAVPYFGLLEIVANVTSDVVTDTSVLRKYADGRWKIHVTGGDANRLVLYDTDGTTPLIKFNLFDAGGTATSSNPYERVKV